MPYAFGLHPGFRWPFAGGDIEDYAIVFDEEERARIQAQGWERDPEFPHRGNEKKESWYTPEFKIRNGTVTVPSAPGLGIQFDPAYLAKAEKVTA